MSSLIKAPFVRIHSSAVRRLKVTEGPIAQQIAAHRANGTDLTAKIWNEYFTLQSSLLSYRWKKFNHEVNFILSGGLPLAALTYKEWIVGFRFAVRLLAVYLFFCMADRGSMFPLVGPESPFTKSVVHTGMADPLMEGIRGRVQAAKNCAGQ